MQPYAPRRRVKIYSIVLDGWPPDWDVFEPALALALNALRSPARVPRRPGLGFLIPHTGRGSGPNAAVGC